MLFFMDAVTRLQEEIHDAADGLSAKKMDAA